MEPTGIIITLGSWLASLGLLMWHILVKNKINYKKK